MTAYRLKQLDSSPARNYAESFVQLMQGQQKMSRGEIIEYLQVVVVRRALADANGNHSKAAKWCGMPRARFYRRLRAVGIEPGRQRGGGK